jgi:signal peptidase I
VTTDRKPGRAAVLGLLYPGLGHLYAGGRRPGVFLLIAVPFILGPAFAVAAIHFPRPLNLLAIYGGVIGVLGLGSAGGAVAARKASRPYSLRWFNRWWVYVGLVLLNAYVFFPLSRAFTQQFIGQAFRIPSAAMEPGILVGDFLFAASNPRPPAHGEIVVFRSVEEPDLLLIKRAVGLGGDTLEMRAGRLFRNGHPVQEPYTSTTDPTFEADSRGVQQMVAWQVPLLVGRDSVDYKPTLRTWGPVALPPSTFFDLGDNRDASYDSRYYGPVPNANTIGRPRTIYYSFDPMTYKPLAPLTAVRWGRLGRVPR